MKILVLSDSHRYLQPMIDAVYLEKPDHIIHLGDLETDAEELSRRFPALPLVSVPGNCDFGSSSDPVRRFTLAGRHFFVTHGHRYGVKLGYERIINVGLSSGADVVLFGHTHCPHEQWIEGALIANPGAIGLGGRSYGVITLDGSQIAYEAKQI